MNYDAAPVQCIANGTTDGNSAGPTTVATGGILVALGVGTYQITYDPGLPGDFACAPKAARIFIQPFNSGVCFQVIKALTSFQVLMTNAETGVPTDTGFDFIVFKAQNVQ